MLIRRSSGNRVRVQMVWKRSAVALFLGALLGAGSASAQVERTEATRIEFRTDLPWTRLLLRGKSNIHGVSPLRVSGPISGDFWLEAEGRGVESERGRVSIRLDEQGSRIVGYGAIGAGAAVVRGLTFPGFAQYRSRDHGKAVLLAASSVGLLVSAGHEQGQVWNEEEQRLEAERLVDETTDAAALPIARAKLRAELAEESAARDKRNLYLTTAGAVWGASLLDAVLFRPGFHVALGEEANLSLEMKKKSLGKALARSVMFPGFGQMYAGQNTKGFLVGTGAILVGTLFLHEQRDYLGAQGFVASAISQLEVLPPGPERDQAERDLAQYEDDLDSAKHTRDLTRLALGAYWGVSLLDTAFTSRDRWSSEKVGEGWDFGLVPDAEGTRVFASRRF